MKKTRSALPPFAVFVVLPALWIRWSPHGTEFRHLSPMPPLHQAAWQPFIASSQQGNRLKVTAFFASDYAGIIERALQQGCSCLDGNKAAIEAVDRPNA